MSKEDVEHLKDIIQELKEEGYTYEELGAKAGVSSTTILRIHRDRTDPRVKTVKKITNALEKMTSEPEKEPAHDLGFTSPFSESQEIKSNDAEIEKNAKVVFTMLDNFLQNHDVSKDYKKNLLRLLVNIISTFLNLSEKNN